MTLPAAPLPTMTLLMEALRAAPSSGARWADGRSGYVARVFRRGRLALAAALEAVRRSAGLSQVTAWLPDYFCNDALDPVRDKPVALNFYPIRHDLTPDWSVLEKRGAGTRAHDVLVLVHYFGFPNAVEETRAFCNRRGMILLEDAAHVLLPGAPLGQGDLAIFSPGKLLAVPSGGVLVAPERWVNALGRDPTGDGLGEPLGWLVRRLAQQLFIHLHISWHPLWGVAARPGTPIHTGWNSSEILRGGDPLTLRLLAVYERSLADISERRRHHYQQLARWFTGLPRARPLFPQLPDGVCPYVLPLRVESGSAQVVNRLTSIGIPASRWADLPPEVLAARDAHGAAIQLAEQVLLLPVHQSLTVSQIDVIGHQVQTALAAVA